MDLTQRKKQLQDLRQEMALRVARTHKHLFRKDTAVSANFSEQAVELANEDVVTALGEEGRRELDLIDKALLRIKEGVYGHCLGCGERILEQRLDALPFAPNCVSCAQKAG